MIKLIKEDFSVDEVLQSIKKNNVGALVTFIGIVRGESDGKSIDLMEIEVYSEMAFKQLNELRLKAIQMFDVKDIYIIHRYGRLNVMDNIVLIAVSATHRSEAFDACEYVIDELKKTVPIWKKEYGKNGEKWVEE